MEQSDVYQISLSDESDDKFSAFFIRNKDLVNEEPTYSIGIPRGAFLKKYGIPSREKFYDAHNIGTPDFFKLCKKNTIDIPVKINIYSLHDVCNIYEDKTDVLGKLCFLILEHVPEGLVLEQNTKELIEKWVAVYQILTLKTKKRQREEEKESFVLPRNDLKLKWKFPKSAAFPEKPNVKEIQGHAQAVETRNLEVKEIAVVAVKESMNEMKSFYIEANKSKWEKDYLENFAKLDNLKTKTVEKILCSLVVTNENVELLRYFCGLYKKEILEEFVNQNKIWMQNQKTKSIEDHKEKWEREYLKLNACRIDKEYLEVNTERLDLVARQKLEAYYLECNKQRIETEFLNKNKQRIETEYLEQNKQRIEAEYLEKNKQRVESAHISSKKEELKKLLANW